MSFRAAIESTRRVLIWALCLLLGFPAAMASAEEQLVVVTENYPPYEMNPPVNDLRGFDYEVVVEAFSRMGFQADIRFLPWKRALNEARQGRAAGILTCAYDDERAKFILFSEPISSFTEGLYVRRDHAGPDIQALKDVVGQPVASMAGYESLKNLKDIGADPVEVRTTDAGLLMLRAGRFDYLMAGKETTDFLIREKALQDEFRFLPLQTENFYFCFSRAYPGVEDLVTKFNRSLAEMRSDGTYDAIHAKYR